MKTEYMNTESTSGNILLTGFIFLANLDFTGYIDYAVKAAIGGVIWMGFKIGTDMLSEKIKKKNQ
ncbi:MAG: hypothetical protein JSS98_03995 [Bacteroidetes bacterium]|nr:hypothetical protein [Bacteroidota bacterium]